MWTAIASAISSVASSVFGGKSKGSGSYLGNLAQSGIESYLGGAINANFQQDAANNNLRRLQSLGLTPQEIAGSGAAGGLSGSGPTLGNGPITQATMAQKAQQREKAKDRQLEYDKIKAGLAQTEMQTRATLGAAETAANANVYATDTRAKTDANRLAFDQQQFSLTLEKHPHELRKIANEAYTSSAGFQTYMKTLGMSAENLRATAIYQKWESQGFDILDPKDWSSATFGDKREVLIELAAHSSKLFNESAAAEHIIYQGGEDAKDKIMRLFGFGK